MCGIVGVAGTGPMSHQMKEFFQQLLFHDVVRGHHATGVAAIDTIDRTLVVRKKAMPAPHFLAEKEIMEDLFAIKHNFNIYIGHNRWATVGAKDDDDNAHPFVHSHLVGVHNGSLRNQRLLDDHKDFVVDSDNLFHHMNKNGLDDMLQKANGAFALCWYDRDDNTLNFIRNEERPLAIAKLTNGYYVWASEIGMLRWLISRHKSLTIDTHTLDGVKYNSIWNLEKDMHFKLTYKDKTRQFDGMPRQVPKKPSTFPVESYGGYGGGRNWGGDSRSSSSSSTSYRVNNTVPAYQQKQKEFLDKFITTGEVSKSVLEVIFKGIVKEPSSTGYISTMALFEYRNLKGTTVKAHVFVHDHSGLVKHLKEEDVGKTYYGTVCTINGCSTSAYKITHNEELGFSLSLSCLSDTKPDRFYSYNKGSVVAVVEEKKEGGAQNVLPFRGEAQQARQTTGTQGSEKSQQEPTSKQTGDAARVVALANHITTQGQFMELVKECGTICSECGARMKDLPVNRMWLLQHYDQEEAKYYNYLTCRRACHDQIVEFTEIIDAEYAEKFGGVDV